MQLTTAFLSMALVAVTVANQMPGFHAGANSTSAVAPKRAAVLSLTCSDLSLRGTGKFLTLAAACTTNLGDTRQASQALNSCFRNAGGVLQCSGRTRGGAMATCDGCSLAADFPPLLGCTCKNTFGLDVPTVIDLDLCVTNEDGWFSC